MVFQRELTDLEAFRIRSFFELAPETPLSRR